MGMWSAPVEHLSRWLNGKKTLADLSEDELDAIVSIAIRQAEALEDSGSTAAHEAWHEVMLYERRLAEVTASNQIAGGVARVGAVRAALAAGLLAEARSLAAMYTSDPSLPDERRKAIERAFEEDKQRRVAARTPVPTP